MCLYFTDFDFRWTMQGGLKIESNRHESLPLLSIRHAGSRFARDTTPYESSRVLKCLRRIESVWVYWTIMNSRATGLPVEDCCVSPSLNKDN